MFEDTDIPSLLETRRSGGLFSQSSWVPSHGHDDPRLNRLTPKDGALARPSRDSRFLGTVYVWLVTWKQATSYWETAAVLPAVVAETPLPA